MSDNLKQVETIAAEAAQSAAGEAQSVASHNRGWLALVGLAALAFVGVAILARLLF